MVDTSSRDHLEEDDDMPPQLPLDSSFFNQLHIKEEPYLTETETETETSSKKRKRVGGDVAMNNSPTFRLPLDPSPNLTPKKRKGGPSLTTSSETPTKRGRGRPRGSGSGSGSIKKEGPSRTTSAETPTNRRPDRTFSTRGAKFTPTIIKANAGQDVVDLLYNISKENRRKTVTIMSVSGSVSDIVNLTPSGPNLRKGLFQLHTMSIKCLTDDNGRHCRGKAICIVTCSDEKGILFASASVNSLIVANRCRVEVIAGLFNTDTAKKTGARLSEFSAAQNDERIPIAAIPLQMIGTNIDSAREYRTTVIKKEASTSGLLPKTPSVGDGNIINPTSATTSASNDQARKSLSIRDNCQDLKFGDT